MGEMNIAVDQTKRVREPKVMMMMTAVTKTTTISVVAIYLPLNFVDRRCRFGATVEIFHGKFPRTPTQPVILYHARNYR